MAVQSGVYRGVSMQERVADRRRRLLDATLTLWAQQGTKVTMTGICAEAGLTERYFYESFAGLDSALGAVLDAVALEIEERTQVARTTSGSDPVARVRAVVTAFVDLMVEDPRKGRVAIIEAGALPELRTRRTALLREFARRSAVDADEIFGRAGPAADAQVAGQVDGQIAGLLFIGGMAELVTAWLEDALAATPDQIIDAATRMFVSLYA